MLDPHLRSQGRSEGAERQSRLSLRVSIGLNISFRTRFSFRERLQGEYAGPVVIDDEGCADPLGSADGSELGQCLIELTRAWTSGKEEIELFPTQRYAQRDERHSLDRCGGWFGFESQAQQPKKYTFVLARRCHSDPPAFPCPVRELQGQSQFHTAQ